MTQIRHIILTSILLISGTFAQTVNNSSLTGKIMCGYQGWFAVPSDAIARGWYHYQKNGAFEPGLCKIDLWPDLTDLDEDEKYITSFKHADGSPAYVFSSQNRKTVVRHFKWMQDYGIDGVFIQRFATEVMGKGFTQWNNVLSSCRLGANQYGRTFAVMYDLSGLKYSSMSGVMNDWKFLIDNYKITSDNCYQFHNGKPVVAVWGIGFNDGRQYTLQECSTLIDFLKNDPKYGGCTVMLGVPTYWRTFGNDAVKDSLLHKVILQADIVSPWFVGRYSSLQGIESHTRTVVVPDLAWCRKNNKEYLPVAFPGFSWHNMNLTAPLNQIPRLKGQFLWKQYYEDVKAGATMIYQAMFDEVDEGTAIFKCTNDPPVGLSTFIDYEDLPTDFYLWLVGQGKRMLIKDIYLSEEIPDKIPYLLKFNTTNSADEQEYLVPGFTGTSVNNEFRHADGNAVIAYKFDKAKLLELSSGNADLVISFEVSNEFMVSAVPAIDSSKTEVFRWNNLDTHVHDASNKSVLEINTKTYFDRGWDVIYLFIADGIKTCAPGGYIYWIKIADAQLTETRIEPDIIPDEMELNQNYPNPFNPETRINYTLTDEHDTELVIYNILGKKIKTLFAGKLGQGSYYSIWNGKSDEGFEVPSGVYIYSLNSGDHSITKKMLLMR